MSKIHNSSVMEFNSTQLCVAGVSRELLSGVLFLADKTSTMHWYNTLLAERLIRIISTSCQPRECFLRSYLFTMQQISQYDFSHTPMLHNCLRKMYLSRCKATCLQDDLLGENSFHVVNKWNISDSIDLYQSVSLSAPSFLVDCLLSQSLPSSF